MQSSTRSSWRAPREGFVALGCAALVAALVLGASPAVAQGVEGTSGRLAGIVADANGTALPGVTVTITSPNLMGERVAAPGVTVVDDGTIPDRRGSLSVDDEGTPTESTVPTSAWGYARTVRMPSTST